MSEFRKRDLKLGQRAGLVSDALLVPCGRGFADLIAYGIDDSGTEGRTAIGV